MNQIAKLFSNGRSQAVRLPAAFRFDGKEVFIRQDPDTGDVTLSRRPANWDGFLASLQGLEVPDSFLDADERSQSEQAHDPFDGWKE